MELPISNLTVKLGNTEIHLIKPEISSQDKIKCINETRDLLLEIWRQLDSEQNE